MSWRYVGTGQPTLYYLICFMAHSFSGLSRRAKYRVFFLCFFLKTYFHIIHSEGEREDNSL